MNQEKKQELLALVEEYVQDPNCWPELWICGEGYTAEEQQYFIQEAIKRLRHDLRMLTIIE